jgi:hypothetical protein
LGQQQPRLNGLPEPNLVGENRPIGERVLKCEQGRFDLMGVQIDLSVGESPS